MACSCDCANDSNNITICGLHQKDAIQGFGLWKLVIVDLISIWISHIIIDGSLPPYLSNMHANGQLSQKFKFCHHLLSHVLLQISNTYFFHTTHTHTHTDVLQNVHCDQISISKNSKLVNCIYDLCTVLQLSNIIYVPFKYVVLPLIPCAVAEEKIIIGQSCNLILFVCLFFGQTNLWCQRKHME